MALKILMQQQVSSAVQITIMMTSILASISYRRDGSSRFTKDNRWGDFYSKVLLGFLLVKNS